MKRPQLILVLGLNLIMSVIAATYVSRHTNTDNPNNPPLRESAYARVMRTGTLRCGYAMWPTLLEKDPNSGKLSGLSHDYVEALGQALHLKVEWAEEIGWGDFPTALDAGRIDVFCTGAWPTASRARQVDFLRPIVFQAMYAYVRADDHRFDNKYAAINDPSVVIATLDGEMSTLVAAEDFPQAKTLQIQQLSTIGETILNVVDRKADVTLTDSETASNFDAKNPGKIRRVDGPPLRVLGDPLVIAKGEHTLRRMLDVATDELVLGGKIEKIITTHERFPGTFLRVASPYVEGSAR